MKKVLCYIALVLLTVLIITPPLVRVLYKEKDEAEGEIKDKFELLICNKGNFTISTSYKNNEPLNIKFEHFESFWFSKEQLLFIMGDESGIFFTVINY